jgi:hypothetical protein
LFYCRNSKTKHIKRYSKFLPNFLIKFEGFHIDNYFWTLTGSQAKVFWHVLHG